MDEQQTTSLKDRIHALELASRAMRVQLQRWKVSTLVLLLSFFVLSLLGAEGEHKPDSIRVRRVELTGPQGELGAVLECTADGTALAFSDAKGKVRVALSALRSGQLTLDFCDENGKPRMRLGQFADRSVAMAILGEPTPRIHTRRLVEIGVTGDDTGFVSLYDKGDINRVLLSALAGPDGAPSFRLIERTGTREIKLDCKPTGAAAVNVVELDTGRRVGLGVPRAGVAGPGMSIFGPGGHLVGVLQVLGTGDAALQLRDRNQGVLIQIPQEVNK